MADRTRTPNLDRQGAQVNVSPVDPSTLETAIQLPSDFVQPLQYGAALGTSGATFSDAANNLLPNGGFEQGLTGWTQNTWTGGTLDTTTFTEGTQSFSVVDANTFGNIASDKFDIPAGLQAVRWSADGRVHRRSGATALHCSLQVSVNFYDSSGANIDTATGLMQLYNDLWDTAYGTFTVPANAAQFAVVVEVTNDLAADLQINIDNVQVVSVPVITAGVLQSAPGGARVLIEDDSVAFYPDLSSASFGQIYAARDVQNGDPTLDTVALWIFGPSAGAQTGAYVKLSSGASQGEADIFALLTPKNGIANMKVGNVNWNDYTFLANNNFQTITAVSGSDTLLATPDLTVKTGVLAYFTGDCETLAANALVVVHIGVLLDGGTTFTFGKSVSGNVGVGAGGNLACPFACSCSLTGIPTGAIKLQLQAKVAGTSETSFTFRNMEVRYVIQPSL